MNPSEAKLKVLEDLKAGKHVLLYGPHGIGKNFSVNEAAKKLGIGLVRVSGAEDLKEQQPILLAGASTDTLEPIAFVFQDAENIDDIPFLEAMVAKSVHPIVFIMVAIPSKIPTKLKSKFDVIRFPEPRLAEVVAIVKSVVPKSEQQDFSHVSTDIRQSIASVQGGSETYAYESTIEELEELFMRNKLDPNLERHRWLWSLVYHNIPNFYLAPFIPYAYEILQEAQLYDQPKLLTLLPRGHGKATFPKNLGRY